MKLDVDATASAPGFAFFAMLEELGIAG